MIKHLEKTDNFEELTKQKCLLDFYADWCGPCHMMGEVLEKMDSELNIPVIKINTDVFDELSMKFGVMSIPTLILMEDNKELKKSIGFKSEDDIKEFIK